MYSFALEFFPVYILSMRISIFSFLILFIPNIAFADDWPGPVVREVFSESRDFFVRVIPGESLGDTVGFDSADQGKYAVAELYRLEKPGSYELVSRWNLLNPIAPVDCFVSDQGHLITLDNWHNMGYGEVVVFYDRNGAVLKKYQLEKLFPASLVDKIPMSVSSRWWRSKPVHFTKGQQELYVPDSVGGNFVFTVQTGEFKYVRKKNP
jgi:hypothetical protein